eukprot:symbB.v1.2.041947.t1/scaffold8914.1/size4680/1
MAAKRSHEETVSLDTLRAILKEEVTKPLREELAQVASTAQASYTNSTKALQELSSLGDRTTLLEASIQKMEDRIKQCESKPVSLSEHMNMRGPSSVSTASSSAHLACLFGGFPTDSKKKDIEEHVQQLLKDIDVVTHVDRFYAPGVRASICRVDVIAQSDMTSREAAFDIMKKLNEKPSYFKGKKLWFTINKSPKEREIASFVARTMKALAVLKLDPLTVDGDFRRGIVWVNDTKIADFTVSHQFPLTDRICHEAAATELEAQCCIDGIFHSLHYKSPVIVFGGDLNVNFSQEWDDLGNAVCFGESACAQLAISSLAAMGLKPSPQATGIGPLPTRYGWPGQNQRPRALDWLAGGENLSHSSVCEASNLLLNTDHLAVMATLTLAFSDASEQTARRVGTQGYKGYRIWSDESRQSYNRDIEEINSFFVTLWQAWCVSCDFDNLISQDVTSQMTFTQNISFDELVAFFNGLLHSAFMRYASRPQPLRFVESDELKNMELARRKLQRGSQEQIDLSKAILAKRRHERQLWKAVLVTRAAQGSWRHKRVLSRLDTNGYFRHVQIPMHLSSIHDEVVSYSQFAEAALEALSCFSASHDLFVDSAYLVSDKLDQLDIQCRQDDPFTLHEFGQALMGLCCGKSVGSDNLISELFMSMEYDRWHSLLDWCNKIFLGVLPWPTVWNLAVVHLIPKVRLPKSVLDFRPISITAIGYKLFMRMVSARLAQQVGGSTFGQAAGYKGCQVHSVLSTLHVLVDKAREWRIPLYILSWDFAKAFDSVEWHAILRLLTDKDVSTGVQRALIRGFSRQSSYIRIYGIQADGECHPSRGIKQGAPESSTVFSMVVDHILGDISFTTSGRDDLFSGPYGFPHAMAWVDDLYLMASSLPHLQHVVDQVAFAFGSVGLVPNFKKLQLLCNESAAPGRIQVQQQVVECQLPSHSIRVLGMQFNMQRGVIPHVECAVSRAWQAFSAHRKTLCDRSVSLPQRVSILNMLVQPLILWCSCNWPPNRTLVARINSVQVRMLTYMTGFSRRPDQTWLDAHRVRFRLMWTKIREQSLLHQLPHPTFYAWGLKYLQQRHGWIGHAFRHSPFVRRAYQWRSFHWWWRQQCFPVTGKRHPGRYYPVLADSDLRQLFLKVRRATHHETIFAMADCREFWASTLPVYLTMYKDLRLHGPSTAALHDAVPGNEEERDEQDEVRNAPLALVHDLRQQT